MNDARSDNDRLPWLDAPRTAPRPAPAARRARTPLLALLGLFLAGGIAVMAFLAGRSTIPQSPPPPLVEQRLPPPAAAERPVAAPRPAAPIAAAPLPAPVAAPPTPAPQPRAASRVESVEPRVTPAKARRKATSRRSAKSSAKRPPIVAERPAARLRPVPPAYIAPRRRTPWPARPFAGPPGRVIQIGAYITPAQADAGWWQVARAYPYLTTLPRIVTPVGPTPGRARTYQVRLAAGSGREARALCRHLHRIGRGCVVVRTQN